MVEWTDAQIRILIDERRNRNEEYHNLGRNRTEFWASIAIRINRDHNTSFNGSNHRRRGIGGNNTPASGGSMRELYSGSLKLMEILSDPHLVCCILKDFSTSLSHSFGFIATVCLPSELIFIASFTHSRITTTASCKFCWLTSPRELPNEAWNMEPLRSFPIAILE
ncbi:10228_t:CDS:2 [Ambispora gerdemannii]|uniref:10228_t:CDS:1 n=1 Tax=Ambispora gerdemannii TaxID=144530 RepID=A0A9N8YSC4_9GLOM|nr:10228_t:CDS:2 [Ambispora gerdemannii]